MISNIFYRFAYSTKTLSPRMPDTFEFPNKLWPYKQYVSVKAMKVTRIIKT